MQRILHGTPSPQGNVPKETILVSPDRVRAHPRVARALVQLEDAGVHGPSYVERRGAVEVHLRAREHVREEGVRVEET